MKIRIKGNSLRYRLTRTDVQTFITNGLVEEQINFGDTILTYALRQTENNELSATYEDNKITLFMPYMMVLEWNDLNTVGFGQDIDGLYLLVEKDFACLDNVGEDQSDNYPNPSAGK